MTAPEFKEEAFEKNVADKGEVVEKILQLDEGFNSVFNRIKEELQNNKKKYAKDIERLKTLVASVTELGVRIQAQELRNKQLVEKDLHRCVKNSVRRNARPARQMPTIKMSIT